MTTTENKRTGNAAPASATAASEIELRYWLANEDWYPSRYTRSWLERTSPPEAAETLARISEDAFPESHLPWVAFFAALAVAGFFPSNAIAGRRPDARKAGLRAALMLAERNDIRALPALVRVFETSRVWQGKYQEAIEAGLLRLLEKNANSAPVLQPYSADIHQLAERIWKAGAGRRDIPPRQARLFLASLPHLTGSESREFLQAVSEAGYRAPNRRQIQEAVKERLAALEAPQRAATGD